jgi:hypothetical protein
MLLVTVIEKGHTMFWAKLGVAINVATPREANLEQVFMVDNTMH